MDPASGASESDPLQSKESDHFDPLYGSKNVKDLYLKANPEFNGLYMLPILWDKRESKIVNNESSEIVNMLNSKFDEFATNKQDFSPKTEEHKNIETFLNEQINMGVYKVGFSTTQKEYDDLCGQLFDSINQVNDFLG